MTNIFFDLDGTLINSQYRLYNLFVELCPECKMSYEQYWDIKRQRINQKDFLKKYYSYSDKEYENFHKIWLDEVEKPERLKQDFLVEGTEKFLEKLTEYNLYIVTNRQSKELTIKELEELGIKKYFKDILITEQNKTKVQLIKENVKYSKDDVLVTDTGGDIKAAKELKIKSYAVTWGILSKEILKEYEPDSLFESLDDIIFS